jgi:hypothetical protein
MPDPQQWLGIQDLGGQDLALSYLKIKQRWISQRCLVIIF